MTTRRKFLASVTSSVSLLVAVYSTPLSRVIGKVEKTGFVAPPYCRSMIDVWNEMLKKDPHSLDTMLDRKRNQEEEARKILAADLPRFQSELYAAQRSDIAHLEKEFWPQHLL